MIPKTFFALDFDGVICNSAIETALTSWKAAQIIWPDMQGQVITDKHVQQFSLVRPHLEVGYEAILIMHLLQQGIAINELLENYHKQLKSVIDDNHLNTDELKDIFGKTRDVEIEKNESAWTASNPLFDAIAEKLKALKQEDWVIVTTKQERFVTRILQANDIQLDEERIFGLDRKLNKQAVLKILKTENPDRPITFVEDRLPTLLGVLNNPDLRDIKLQLVDWGYNTRAEKKAATDKGIEVISKESFLN